MRITLSYAEICDAVRDCITERLPDADFAENANFVWELDDDGAPETVSVEVEE